MSLSCTCTTTLAWCLVHMSLPVSLSLDTARCWECWIVSFTRNYQLLQILHVQLLQTCPFTFRPYSSVMYAYYLYSALDESVKKSIWWKKHITQIQLIQFLLLGVHFSVGIIARHCTYPIFFCIVMSLQNLFMLFMFGDFYRRTYLRKKQK